MKFRVTAAIAAALISSIVFSANCRASATPPVRTLSGLIEGMSEQGVRVYKGIPFAAPPVGDFRWRDPQPVASVDGRSRGPIVCTDLPAKRGLPPGAPSEPKSEDCLYLNVWAPAARPKRSFPSWCGFTVADGRTDRLRSRTTGVTGSRSAASSWSRLPTAWALWGFSLFRN